MKGINLYFPGVTESGEDRTEYGSVVECFRGMEAKFEFSWSMTQKCATGWPWKPPQQQLLYRCNTLPLEPKRKRLNKLQRHPSTGLVNYMIFHSSSNRPSHSDKTYSSPPHCPPPLPPQAAPFSQCSYCRSRTWADSLPNPSMIVYSVKPFANTTWCRRGWPTNMSAAVR